MTVEDIKIDGKIDIKTHRIHTPQIINGHIISIDIKD